MIIASVNLLVPFMADINTMCLFLDVPALRGWGGASLHSSESSQCLTCLHCSLTVPQVRKTLHQFLGLEEAFEVLHLPNAGDDEDERLGDGPPENALVGALARHAKALLTIL